MTFARIRSINGRRYRYEEERWREGGKVRSRSRCLGPIDDVSPRRRKERRSGGLLSFVHAQRLSAEDRALHAAERAAARLEQYQHELFGETALERAERERQGHLAKLHELYGLRLGPPNPVPIEPRSSSPRVEAKEGPAEAGPVVEPSEDSE
jgi:hypothetical protein